MSIFQDHRTMRPPWPICLLCEKLLSNAAVSCGLFSQELVSTSYLLGKLDAIVETISVDRDDVCTDNPRPVQTEA
jgi:hypothetical protein